MGSIRKQSYKSADTFNQPTMVDDGEAYRFLLENMSEVVWQISPDLRFTYVNPANEQLLGYTPREVIGRSIFDLMTPLSADCVRKIAAERQDQARRGERLEKLTYEIEHVCKDGRTIWAEVISNPVYDSQGRLTTFNGITRDISARRQAEEALRNAEIRYRMLFELSPDGIVIINPATARLLEFNEAAHRQLGYSREELFQLSISDFEVDETPQEIQTHITKILQEGRDDFETRHRTKQGEIRNIHVTAQLIEIFGKTIYHCIWRDITEQKRAEDALRESEEQLRVLSENLADGMVYQINSGLDGRQRMFTYLSPAIERFHGLRIEDAKRNPSLIYDQVDGKHRVLIAEAEAHAYATGSKLDIDLLIRLPSGDDRWRRFISSPHTDSNGSIIWDGIELDITERKRAEDETAILVEIGRVIGSTLDIKEVYERFASITAKLIPFDSVSVNLIDVPNNIFNIAYNSGFDLPGRTVGLNIPLTGTMTEYVMNKRNAMMFNASSVEEMTRLYPGITRVLSIQSGFFSNILIPLFANDTIIGVLHFRVKKHHVYGEADLRLAERIGMQIASAVANAQLFAQLKKTIDLLQDSEKILKDTLDGLEITIAQRTMELEETNTALRVLVKKGEKDQKTLGENLQSNVNQLVTPFLSKLRVSRSNPERLTYLNILEANLNNIISPFINRLSAAYQNLTPKEIQIAEMVRQGKLSKEIAELFGISVGTVITHRNNIRKKLDLTSRDANLRSHLLFLA